MSTYYVNNELNSNGDGLSWDTAFNDVTELNKLFVLNNTSQQHDVYIKATDIVYKPTSPGYFTGVSYSGAKNIYMDATGVGTKRDSSKSAIFDGKSNANWGVWGQHSGQVYKRLINLNGDENGYWDPFVVPNNFDPLIIPFEKIWSLFSGIPDGELGGPGSYYHKNLFNYVGQPEQTSVLWFNGTPIYSVKFPESGIVDINTLPVNSYCIDWTTYLIDVHIYIYINVGTDPSLGNLEVMGYRGLEFWRTQSLYGGIFRNFIYGHTNDSCNKAHLENMIFEECLIGFITLTDGTYFKNIISRYNQLYGALVSAYGDGSDKTTLDNFQIYKNKSDGLLFYNYSMYPDTLERLNTEFGGRYGFDFINSIITNNDGYGFCFGDLYSRDKIQLTTKVSIKDCLIFNNKKIDLYCPNFVVDFLDSHNNVIGIKTTNITIPIVKPTDFSMELSNIFLPNISKINGIKISSIIGVN